MREAQARPRMWAAFVARAQAAHIDPRAQAAHMDSSHGNLARSSTPSAFARVIGAQAIGRHAGGAQDLADEDNAVRPRW